VSRPSAGRATCLGQLIALYDDQPHHHDATRMCVLHEDVLKRYEAYGWHGATRGDGNG